MRIALVFATLFFGISFGAKAIATVNEYQEAQAEKFCQIDPNYCK
jgi:regulator of protease activity HflC (stomatin/prohibitin superfamily)